MIPKRAMNKKTTQIKQTVFAKLQYRVKKANRRLDLVIRDRIFVIEAGWLSADAHVKDSEHVNLEISRGAPNG